jgi:hypothetical protein
MAVSPEQAAADWVAGLSAKTAKIQASVQAVTVAPGQLAARQKTAYQQGVAANVDKWARNVGQVSLSDWQQAFITKGVPRIAPGAQAAQAKFAGFMGRLLPYVERGRSNLPARGTFEQNVQRATAWMQYMHGFSNTGSK